MADIAEDSRLRYAHGVIRARLADHHGGVRFRAHQALTEAHRRGVPVGVGRGRRDHVLLASLLPAMRGVARPRGTEIAALLWALSGRVLSRP